jgi:sugar/nucleoside kinase (ribokinase family)
MGKTGQDEFGEVFAHDLRALGVHFTTSPSDDLPTGRCLSFVTPDAQRSMIVNLGAASQISKSDIDVAVVQNSAITYLEGYQFDQPSAQDAFRLAAQIAHAAGRKVALTLSDVFCVERHRDAFQAMIAKDVDILFANEAEAKALYQTDDWAEVVARARAQTDIAVLTRSERGALIAAGDMTYDVPAHPVGSVVDTTGAGDLYAAGFLFGMTQGKDLAEAGRIGAIAASEVISHYGPRPQVLLAGLI